MAPVADGSCACSCSQTAGCSLQTLREELKEVKDTMATGNAVISLQMEQLCSSLIEVLVGLRAVTQLCVEVRCGPSAVVSSDQTHGFVDLSDA